ncbi:MAG TPA: class I SAM-dependent methyltransferase [Acidimicrobiales bacterium]|nr:class I SAM-dependent methyltransferase [Acidimicrobiales bacterium]
MTDDAHVHQAAATGFERGATEYDLGRPGYPGDVLRLLRDDIGVGPGVVVVDVGAGTGKFTRLLVSTGADVIAVEPVASMRVVLQMTLPDVPVHSGTAERLPIDDESVDVVAAAQAFHWFEAGAALAEAHRVLRPGGALVLVGNKRDDRHDWVRDLEEVHLELAGDAPRYLRAGVPWVRTIAESGGFDAVEHLTFDNPVRVDVPTFRARESSISYISALPDAEREEVLDRVERIVRSGPMAAGGETFVEPYLTDVYWCRRR